MPSKKQKQTHAAVTDTDHGTDQFADFETRRDQINAHLTRFSRFINGLTHEEVESASKSIEIQLRIDKLEPLWAEFDKVQSYLEDQDQTDTQATYRNQFENEYFQAISQAKKSCVTPVTQQSSSSRSSLNAQPDIKLPKINLIDFNGSYDKWLQFHDTFSALIQNNTNLSNIQKFFYLQSSLKGEAAQVIQSLEVNEANYDVAWQLLRDRFENKRVIVNSHVKGIFELPNLPKESHNLLRNFLDTFLKHFRSLQTLKEPVEQWATMLIYMLSSKLDSVTKREWEMSIKGTASPSMEDFTKFLVGRCQLLEAIENKAANNPVQRKQTDQKILSHASMYQNHQNPVCEMCKGSHLIYKCKKFLDLTPEARHDEMRRLKLCTNCLRVGHSNSDCRSGGCRRCGKKHNTLLHFEQSQPSNDSRQSVNTHCNQLSHESQILLSTAIVYIADSQNNFVKCRALLDSGSQSNFMTRALQNRLKLRETNINFPICGINQVVTNITEKTQTTIKSRTTQYKTTLSFLIMNHITGNLPQQSFSSSTLNVPNHIILADPLYHESSQIDILLGASIFFDLLCVGQVKLGNCLPILQKSHLGWILSGPLRCFSTPTTSCMLTSNQSNHIIQDQLERFWKLEDHPQLPSLSQEQLECEKHFVQNFERDAIGRFTVKLPLRENYQQLGDSQEMAIKRFHSIERKLQRTPELRNDYVEFMKTYEAMGHMTEISQIISNDVVYYLPHHSVQKQSSFTTKTRIVFDASAKTTSNLSLNDCLKIGPTIQSDLFSLLIRFRKHNIAFTADVAKMYRQVNIHKDQRDLQRIVWRSSPDVPLKHYQLNTVTYGTASAPFLATRCLVQVAKENKKLHPKACQIIRDDFYVDDLITGCTDVDSGICLKRDIESVLHSAGFELRQWIASNPHVLTGDPKCELSQYILTDDGNVKTLGVSWDSHKDEFYYTANMPDNFDSKNVTKRTILSVIAQIFDPLGIVGPVVLKAKLILQKLWQLGLTWDESIPMDLYTTWSKLYNQFSNINEIRIPRHVLVKYPVFIQVHAFCDASELAYGSCVYIYSRDKSNTPVVRLLCSKSRVAPLKIITIPRLELCGALLMTQLVERMIIALKLPISTSDIHYWCDSTIALHWIFGEPSSWKTFVSHRVSKIQQLSQGGHWHHVSSGDNPADILSRGMEPAQLAQTSLWWNGPVWLKGEQVDWPEIKITSLDTIPEVKQVNVALVSSISIDIFTRFSTFRTLQRVIAYCLRFKINSTINRDNKFTGPLTIAELNNSLSTLVKLTQAQTFESELKSLRDSKNLQNSQLRTLNPFLDGHGIIRVGGRLRNSQSPFNMKHPIVLPSNHPFTRLIIAHEHHKNLHAGPQAILSTIRQNYWPLSGRRTVRSVLRKCITCFRAKPGNTPVPPMGNLPNARVISGRVFSNSGVDYAGPFFIKSGTTRNCKIVKSYVCIFICFASKAVHLELVSDLTADSFLNALKRFISRRGLCSQLYSDNATNFVGANRELRSIAQKAETPKVKKFVTENNIRWHFIPSKSPHFGGIWEAAVKSAKYHLRRVLTNISLTFEEFYTLLTQVEATLNSRPLYPMSNDPNDYETLTAGHLLIGAPMNAAPQEDVTDMPIHRRYFHLQKMYQHFWNRWNKDYLHHLQQSTKGKAAAAATADIQPGALVILKEENTPPMSWPMGRIVAIHPGQDGIVRVVSVQTRSGIVKRAVVKICLMPVA